MHKVVIFGEILAIAAIVMAMLFVTVDRGRPDRFWHLVPGLGQFNFPWSILTWDVLVLNGYLMLNLHICGYPLYMKFLGRASRAWKGIHLAHPTTDLVYHSGEPDGTCSRGAAL
jgi:formate-dependent nitrite reductase membrane component NrfD